MALLPLGLGWGGWHAQQRLDQQLPQSLEEQPLSVEGYVCSIPHPGAFQALRFDFCVTNWPVATGVPPGSDWYGTQRRRRRIPAQVGRLRVRLRRPHGTVNPAGFRYGTWLFRQGFIATGKVDDWLAADIPCTVNCQFQAWRRHLVTRFHTIFTSLQHAPLVTSLVFGARGGLVESQWQTLRADRHPAPGCHFRSASGASGRPAWAAFPQPLVTHVRRPAATVAPAPFITLVVLIAGCTGYAALAGFSIATQRALIMVAVAPWR